MTEARDAFLQMLLSNAKARALLDRAGALGLPDWWLTGGAVFQSVWNALDGRPTEAGILDYDLFYFDADDLSAESELAAGRAAAALLTDLEIPVEVSNEARVHLWYEDAFGVPGCRFHSSRDAIDHFAAITCCYGVTRRRDGELIVYAPHGFDDLLARRVRANPVIVPREVYERKTLRWSTEWPSLSVEPWPLSTLETPRLSLLPWRDEHVELLRRLAAVAEVMTHIGPGETWSAQRSREVGEAAVGHWAEHCFGWRVARERESGRLVGFLGLNFAGEGTEGVAADEYEIGWWMEPAVWGRGYAREGGRAIRDEALDTLHAPSVIARIQPANVRSIAVAGSLGLTHDFETTGRTGEAISVHRLAATNSRDEPVAKRT